MSSRIVTRVGKDASKYVQALLRNNHPSVETRATIALSRQIRGSSSQHFLQQAQYSNRHTNVRYFSDKASPPPEDDNSKDESASPSEEATTTKTEEETKEEETAAEPEISREEQLEQELKDVKDQLLRSMAEQENTRRIAQRDVQDARNFAVKSFAKSLLDVADNLSRALEVVPEEVRHDKEGNATLATLYEGIEMTETGLMKAFEVNGLKKYGEAGETFDPNLHSALYEYPDSEKEPGTVGQVVKVGYLLNNRVLRPAEVGVVKKE